jgi:hypothetical protein
MLWSRGPYLSDEISRTSHTIWGVATLSLNDGLGSSIDRLSGELGAWVYCLNLLHKLLVPVLRPGEVGKGFGHHETLADRAAGLQRFAPGRCKGVSGYARASYPTIHFLSRTMPVVRLRKLAAGDLEGHGMGKRPVQSRKGGAYTSASSLRHLLGSCGIHFGNI